MKNRRKRKVHRGRRKQNRFVRWFKGLSRKKKIGLCVGGIILLILLAVVIFVMSKFAKIQEADFDADDLIINQEVEEKVGTGYTNFVLFAGDSRTGQLNKGVRSDGIIIVSLNNATSEVKMVSVYRDTLLDLSEGSLAKCNAAYSYGGAKQAINMLNMNLDLNIKKFVTVDFTAVSDVIDMLGGIEVDVSEAEVYATNKYIRETARVAGKKATLLKKSGLQTLNGVQATTYGRIRKGVGDDFARTERQRLIIQKAMEKALKTDILTLNKIVDKVLPKIYTNLTSTEIMSYATGLAKYKIGETKGFPFDKTGATLAGRGSCVIPVTLEDNVRQLHEFLFGKTDYQPTSTVQSISGKIQNLVGARNPDPNTTYNPDNYKVPSDDKKPSDNKSDGKNNTTTKHTHAWASGWTASGTHHWHECGNANCPITNNASKNGYGAHSGGTATCASGPVCSVCGKVYGNPDKNKHTGETEIRNKKEATTTEAGYTGDVCCKGCGAVLQAGEVIPQIAENPSPGEGDGPGNEPSTGGGSE